MLLMLTFFNLEDNPKTCFYLMLSCKQLPTICQMLSLKEQLISGFINTEATCILYISFVYLLVRKSGWAHVDSKI